MAKHPLRLTINEICTDMRDMGFPVTAAILSDEMEAGKYPFASMVRKGGTGRRTFEISRKAYENWKEINLRSV